MPSSSISSRRGPGSRKAGRRVDRLAHDLAAGLALGVADLEVLLLGAGRGDLLEGGVGDVLADLALHGDLGAAADLDVVDDALRSSGGR